MKSTVLLGAGDRLGIVPAPQLIPTTLADVPGVFHASVRSPYGPSGGVGWTNHDAVTAAIGEALERFAAASIELPAAVPTIGVPTLSVCDFALFSTEQQRRKDCPWKEPTDPVFVAAHRLHDGAAVHVPRLLLGLNDPDGTGIATSNGLAAGPSVERATERALQEVIERDALMVAWLHGLVSPSFDLPDHLRALVVSLGGDVRVVDLTPSYSAWPVVAVCGSLPWRGRVRIGMGSACRPTYAEAVEKAFLEWSQATVFVGVQMTFGGLKTYATADDVTTFEDHALYYSAHPDRWAGVPLLLGPVDAFDSLPTDNVEATTAVQVERLRMRGFDVARVVFGAPDLDEIGVAVVRVLVPGLASVNADHRWPYLGGATNDWRLRFPASTGPTTDYPSPFPHPLG
jgi:ribosomal protein S12 methylthiotransferase accessory factor